MQYQPACRQQSRPARGKIECEAPTNPDVSVEGLYQLRSERVSFLFLETGFPSVQKLTAKGVARRLRLPLIELHALSSGGSGKSTRAVIHGCLPGLSVALFEEVNKGKCCGYRACLVLDYVYCLFIYCLVLC